MLFTKAFKKLLAIALLSIFLGFDSLFAQVAIAQPISNTQTEKLEFKQLIDQTHAAWNSHNPDALSKFYAKEADLIFYDALPMQYKGWDDYKAGIQKNLFDKMPKFIESSTR